MFEFNGCKQEYDERWRKANMTGELSQEDWEAWFVEHCAKCPAMSEICMADEYVMAQKLFAGARQGA